MSERFTYRFYKDGDQRGYEVWDTERDEVAKRKDGTPARYFDREAYTWASKRAANLNKFGYDADNYNGRWKPGSRGRPPKSVNGRGGNGRGASVATLTETPGTPPPSYTEAAKIEAAATAREVATQIATQAVGRNATPELSKEVIEAAIESVKQEATRKLDDALASAKYNADTAVESLLASMDAGQRAADDLLRLVERTNPEEILKERLTVAQDMAVDEMARILEAMKEEIKQHKALTISSERGTKIIKDRTHARFEALVRAIAAGVVPMLVGPAGSGKTFAAEQCASAFDVPFYAMAVGSQSSKSDFLGFITATGEYRGTQFREAYEKGGLFLCDEIDAGNANVLIVINAALSGTFCAFPDKMVRKHENFIFVGTANTYGTGASRQYVGRNQLDAATLDRFVAFDWPIDENLEAATVEHFEHGAKWHNVVKSVRRLVESTQKRIVVSPRATIKGAHLIAQGFAINEVIEMTLLGTADANDRTVLMQTATSAWGV